MSGLDWIAAALMYSLAVFWCEIWYRRLESQLTAKLKLDEAAVDAMERICGRLEVIGNEIAEANAMMADDSDDDEDDAWKLN